MKPGQIEQVSEELAANLPVCPKCGRAPTIYKCLDGCPPRPIISIFCPCEFEYDSFKKFDWHPSLFEAVNIWSLTAKLLGGQETVAPDPLAGQFYTDETTSMTQVWNGLTKKWEYATDPSPNDVPF